VRPCRPSPADRPLPHLPLGDRKRRSLWLPPRSLSPFAGSARLGRSLSPPKGRSSRGAPSHVPCRSSRPGSRRLHAGHRLAKKRAPARLLPGRWSPSRSCCHLSLRNDPSTATPPARGCAPSSRSPPGASRAPFPPRSPRRSSANAAGGGLKPPPTGRLRRAYLHLLHSTTSTSSPCIEPPSTFVAHLQPEIVIFIHFVGEASRLRSVEVAVDLPLMGAHSKKCWPTPLRRTDAAQRRERDSGVTGSQRWWGRRRTSGSARACRRPSQRRPAAAPGRPARPPPPNR
jgi:hypothetical protein